MEAWRYEPHRIGTKFLHYKNCDQMFFSVKYLFHVFKIDGKWLTKQIDYDVKVFQEPAPKEIYL